jgi:hypothetical protein
MRAPPLQLLHLLLLSSATTFAQTTAPGLWEMQKEVGDTPEMAKATADMQKQLAALPPAQRKHLEATLSQSGISMRPGGAVTVRVCITPEMATRFVLHSHPEGNCTHTIASRNGNSFILKFACKNPPTSGEDSYTFYGDKAYSMKRVMQSIRNGKPETMRTEGRGKWLSADCGNIKPIQIPK